MPATDAPIADIFPPKSPQSLIINVVGKEISGKITLKHIYEIAKIKGQDPPLITKSDYELCNMLIGIAKSCGIQIVDKLDPAEYGEFLAERKIIVEEQRKELQLKKEAKMLRTS